MREVDRDRPGDLWAAPAVRRRAESRESPGRRQMPHTSAQQNLHEDDRRSDRAPRHNCRRCARPTPRGQLATSPPPCVTIKQRKISARAAWLTEIGLGREEEHRQTTQQGLRKHRRHRQQRQSLDPLRSSRRCSQTASSHGHQSHGPAINRWPCSARTFSIVHQRGGLRPPYEVGQSGTERPASRLFTRPPAVISRTTKQARKVANRCGPRSV